MDASRENMIACKSEYILSPGYILVHWLLSVSHPLCSPSVCRGT